MAKHSTHFMSTCLTDTFLWKGTYLSTCLHSGLESKWGTITWKFENLIYDTRTREEETLQKKKKMLSKRLRNYLMDYRNEVMWSCFSTSLMISGSSAYKKSCTHMMLPQPLKCRRTPISRYETLFCHCTEALYSLIDKILMNSSGYNQLNS